MTTKISGAGFEELTIKNLILTKPLVEEYGGTGSSSTRQLAQIVTFQTGAVATGTTILPLDNTIPQNTEGNEYMSLSITPTNAGSTLEIEVISLFTSTVPGNFTGALFQDSTANALAAIYAGVFGTDQPVIISIKHLMTAGTTSPTVFKLRAGASSAFTATFNGAAGSRLFGDVMASRITIKEYLP